MASELAGRGPLWIKYILVNNRLYDYTAYVRRISNYTSYVRRIIRYLKNKCTVQCMYKATSVIQSSFWRDPVKLFSSNAFTSEKETSETTCEIP